MDVNPGTTGERAGARSSSCAALRQPAGGLVPAVLEAVAGAAARHDHSLPAAPGAARHVPASPEGASGKGIGSAATAGRITTAPEHRTVLE